MHQTDKYIFKCKFLISLSVFFVIAAITLIILKNLELQKSEYKISYEYVNIKDMATAAIANKKDTTNILTTLTTPKDVNTLEEISLPIRNNTVPTLAVPKQIWHLPVEVGVITSNPNYSHVALDITSYRGTAETIYPIANGTVSGIYTDSAGAKIVTVHHVINGINYTSQYVHLSSYASNLYVGKPVTINDYLGNMGTTGRSTGVHLHLAVVDCTLFDPNDANCRDLNGFFRYARARYSQGFIGLGTLMTVPGSWTSR